MARGQRQTESQGSGSICSELTYGTFFRTIQLPDGADEKNIEAVVRNGVLEIRMPIEQREQGRRVKVQADQSDRSETQSDRSEAGSERSETQSTGRSRTVPGVA